MARRASYTVYGLDFWHVVLEGGGELCTYTFQMEHVQISVVSGRASNVWIVQNMWNVGNVMCGNFRGS